jgi:hypothetical protein
VKFPDEHDWAKLVKMMCYLKNTHKDVIVLSANDSSSIITHVNAAFAVHNVKKSHTGATMSLGGGGVISVSTTQKVNTQSSTEAKLVAINDISSKVVWTKLFLQAQGVIMNQNVIMLYEIRDECKTSSGKQTCHLCQVFCQNTEVKQHTLCRKLCRRWY